jgi:hypothetical protein
MTWNEYCTAIYTLRHRRAAPLTFDRRQRDRRQPAPPTHAPATLH